MGTDPHMYNYMYAGMTTYIHRRTGTTEDNRVPFLREKATITKALAQIGK